MTEDFRPSLTCHSGLALLPKAESIIVISEHYSTRKAGGWYCGSTKGDPYIVIRRKQEKPVGDTTVCPICSHHGMSSHKRNF